MAKFCKYCGQPIPEGGVCSCPEAQAEAAAASAAAEAKIREQVAAAMKQSPANAADNTQDTAPAQENAQAANAQVYPKLQPYPDSQSQQNYANQQYDQQQYDQQQYNQQYNQQQYGQQQYDQQQYNQQYNQQQYGQQQYGQQTSSTKANAQQTLASAQQTMASIAASPVVTELKNYFIGMFRAPVGTIEKAAQAPKKTAQYLLALISAVAELIIVVLFGCLMDWGFGTSFKYGLIIAVCTMVPKLVYALCAYPLAKRYNAYATMSASIGGFCLASIYDAAAILLVMLFMFIQLPELLVAILFAWLIITVLECVAVTAVLTNFNTEAVFRINLILQIIMMIVLVFVGRSLITMTLTSMMNSLFDSLGEVLMDSIW